MLQAIVSHPTSTSISQLFKEWAENKGIDYLRRKVTKDLSKEFQDDTGRWIPVFIVHTCVERLVHQRNRETRGSRPHSGGSGHSRPTRVGRFC